MGTRVPRRRGRLSACLAIALSLLATPVLTSCAPAIVCATAGSQTGNPLGVTEIGISGASNSSTSAGTNRSGYANEALAGITRASDGTMWFADGDQVGHIATGGAVTVYPYRSGTECYGSVCGATDIIAGPNGDLWLTDAGYAEIGRVALDGTVTTFPLDQYDQTNALTTGADGNIWVTTLSSSAGFNPYEQSTIAGVSPQTGAVISDYPVSYGALPAIVSGPDGALWFSDDGNDAIGRITISGVMTTYTLPTKSAGPAGITVGPDGNLWFTERNSDKLGRITPSGKITEYTIAAVGGYQTCGNFGANTITAGPDGNLWFTLPALNRIGRVTTAGAITTYTLPVPHSAPADIAAGPNGTLWFTQAQTNSVGWLTPK